MPDKLIKGYIKEAIWSGGTIVINGLLPQYDNLAQFMKDKIYPYINYAGIHPPIEIDSKKFQIYNITEVPAIVFSNENKPSSCFGKRQFNGYMKCDPIDKTSYWKITGTVSTYYALESFAQNGAPEKNIKSLLTHYARMTGGINTSQQIKSYNGDLHKLPQPYPKHYINQVLAGIGLTQGKNGIIGSPDAIRQLDMRKRHEESNKNNHKINNTGL
jgi:type-F conjugative transfer system pilin assembly protein TrbC